MQRPSQRRRFARACAGALAGAWLAVGATPGRAPAQTALINPDPLAPRLDGDARKVPAFQKTKQPLVKPVDASRTITPPPSGAGNTGFDSTNTPDRRPVPRGNASGAGGGGRAPSPSPGASPGALPSTSFGSASPLPAQPAVSPYQVPPTEAAPDDAGQPDALAQAPGPPPIDAVGPIRRPLKKRKFRGETEDPYAPLGIRAGSFDLYPALEAYGGHDSNPERVSGGSGAKFYTVLPELRAQSNWSRHELKADLRGSYTGYSPDTEPTLSRPTFDGKVDGRVDVTSQTRVDLGSRLLVSTDNPGSPNLQAGLAKLPLFFTYGGSAGIGQRFNRFDLSLKGNAERTEYQDSELTDGTTASNEDRNYNQFGGILRGGYELTPGVVPFASVGIDTREHDLATDVSGYQRDSRGITGKVGSTFELSRLLTGEIGVGYTRRQYDDPRLADVKGLIGDASLIWTATELTTVKLSAASTVGESTQAGVSGVLYRDVGLQVDHAFRRWLIGTVKAGFGNDDYVGSGRSDDRYSVGAGLTFKVNRTLQIKGEFRQEWLRSNEPGNDYNASIFMLGVRLQK